MANKKTNKGRKKKINPFKAHEEWQCLKQVKQN